MNSIELPFNDLIKVYKLAALGKVIGGLIHNLNGPLQNLGLNIEMTAYTLKDDSNLDENSAKNILDRLKNMENEFDRIDRLIRASSAKANPDNTLNNIRQLDDLLHQEISFLQTNLYFKHKVQTDLNIHNNLPLMKTLPQDFLTGLCWFLHALIEDLETCEIEAISFNASFDDSSVLIVFDTHGKQLSDSIMKCLSKENGPVTCRHQGEIDVGLWLALLIFGNCNTSVNGVTGPEGSKVTLTIPVHQGRDK